MSIVKQLKEKRNQSLSELESFMTRTDGREMTAEESTEFDRIEASFRAADDKVKAEERREATRASLLDFGNPNQGASGETRDELCARAFRKALMNPAGITPEERAAITGMGVGQNEIIIPSILAANIEVALKSFGGMLEVSDIIYTAAGGTLTIPSLNDSSKKAKIVDELEDTDKATRVFDSVKLNAYTYRTDLIPVSYELLQDSAYNLEAVLSSTLAENFGRGVNEHFTIGTGINQPKGVITAATPCDNPISADKIGFDDVITLLGSVDALYAKNGTFMFNKNVLLALMKMKNDNGDYIWQGNLASGQPATILGRPYVINDDMANIGTGKTSMAFGDFKRYKIRIVKQFSVMRLNETLASNLAIGLLGFARVDGALVDAGTHPIKTLVHGNI